MSLGNVGLRKLGFLSKNCKNQGQLIGRASQTKKGRESRGSYQSVDRHLALNPSDPYFFRSINFHFRYGPNFSQILISFFDFLIFFFFWVLKVSKLIPNISN